MKKLFLFVMVAVISVSAYCYQTTDGNSVQTHSSECSCCESNGCTEAVAEPTTSTSEAESSVSEAPSAQNRYGYKTCYMCHGSGVCSTCNGKGWFYSPYGTGKIACPNCSNGKCRTCNGTGKVYGVL